WFVDALPITGATASLYTTPLLSLADNGNQYYCVVSNCGMTAYDTSDIAILTVVPCSASAPSITLNHSVCEPGDTLVVSGEGFSIGGTVLVTAVNDWNENIAAGIPVTYISPGKFVMEIPISASLFSGLYTIVALDMVSGVTAPQKSVLVDNQLFNELEIISPTPEEMVHRNAPFEIVW